MNQKKMFPGNKLLFLLIPGLVIVTYLGSTVLSSSTNKKNKGIVKVNNLTRSCELLNVEKHKDHIKLSVQNNGNKAITAFVITSRIDSQTLFTFKEEFASSEGDVVIPPGQSYDKVISLPDRLIQQTEITLNLSAIIFEDKIGEGDPNVIRDVEESRLGEKIQLIKALPILEGALQLSEMELSSYWNKTGKHDLETALNVPDTQFLIPLNKKSLNPNELYNGSEQFKSGAQTGKEDVVQKYQELADIQEKQGTSALREEILRLRSLYARMIDKL